MRAIIKTEAPTPANNNETGSTFRSKTGERASPQAKSEVAADMDTAGSAPNRLVGTLVLGCLLALLRLLQSGSSSARKASKKRSKRAKKNEVLALAGDDLPLERKGEPNCSTNTTPIDPPTAPSGVTKEDPALEPAAAGDAPLPSMKEFPAARTLHSAPCVCRPTP